MIKKLILKFVLRYIRNNVAHGKHRDEIFNALSESLAEEFYEDNIFTRVYYFSRWYAENNDKLKTTNFSQGDLTMLGRNARDGLLDGINGEQEKLRNVKT